MKQQISILIICLFFSCCQNSDQGGYYGKGDIDDDLLGTYTKGYSDMGTNLILEEDGTFINEDYYYSDYIQKGEPSAWITEIKGRFKISSNEIVLYPEVYLTKEIYNDSIVILDSLEYYSSDSTTINTEFIIVRWTGNIYLLSEEASFRYGYRVDNDFVLFADNYNSGSEPRWNGSYFAKRNCKVRYESIDLEQIPMKWRSSFLDSLKQVIVIDVEQEYLYDSTFMCYINRYVLEGGEHRGIREGMTFYGKEGCCVLKIMNTDELTSKGIIELCPYHQNSCKVGDTLISWNKKDNGEYPP